MGRLGDALRQDLNRQAVRIAQTVTADITNDLRRTAPVVTGDLYTSIQGRYQVSTDRVTMDFTATAPYAEYVVEGTRPHPIRARNARALSFYWPKLGGQAFFKSVQHPGTRPNPFWSDVFDQASRYIEAALRRL